jgi:ribosomal protein S18 acetylase RimI-like enzyme
MSCFVCQALAKQHDRRSFRCGVPELDDYLQHRASQDVRRRTAAVFVLVSEDQPQRIAGFYSLSSASIVLEELPGEFIKELPRYPLVPAVLLGRLARDVNYPGVGRLLLLDALARSMRHADEVAAAVVLVDAKNKIARQFYSRYGFKDIVSDSRRMYLPMKTVAKLLESES